VAFAEQAVVHHRVIPMGYGEFLRRRYRWAQVVRLVALNPEARAIFPHPYVAHRAHLAFWVGLPVVGLGGPKAPRRAAPRRRPRLRRQARPHLPQQGSQCPRAHRVRDHGAPRHRSGAVGFLVASVRNRRLLL
jgi:hypothetical protein